MITAIVQARMTSTRLPGKVLREIIGRPMLDLQVERIRGSKKIDKIILATSKEAADQPIADLGRRIGVEVYRGSLENVLDRFYQAALLLKPDHVVRLTGDCPVLDPEIIDQVIGFYLDGGFDYVSNALEPTFPDGLDTEVFSMPALERAWKEAKLPSEREHVTPYFYNHPEIFKIGKFKHTENLSNLRWTVDDATDFARVKAIFEGLYPKNPKFNMKDIVAFAKSNPLPTTSAERNEGYEKSLKRDQETLAKKP